MKRAVSVFSLIVASVHLVAATTSPPLAYPREDRSTTGAQTSMPAFAALASIPHLPDPFLVASGERVSTREQWVTRRAEIKAMLEHYVVGAKPGRPPVVRATLDGSTVRITVGNETGAFEMTATINRPAGAPDTPIPAVIGVNSPTGSLPADLFSRRGVATITFRASEVAPTGFSGINYDAGNFARLYPDATAGYMIRWAWGISRLIDALEMLPEARIDLSRIAVTGCSFAGKAALYAGAWDDRIALTLPQESGGGGTISWRYAEMLEQRDKVEVENLRHAQGGGPDFPWYARALREFSQSPDRLPVDQHQLIALIAPRALLMIESSQVPRMGAEAARVSALAAREVWAALGVPERMGAAEEDTAHCRWHAGYTPDLEAYLDRFLLDRQDGASTDILRSRYTDVDRATWIPWSSPLLR